MKPEIINKTLSEKRFASYLQRCNNNFESALKYYEFNVIMAQSCHTSLEGFEVLLRNKIHYIFSKVFGTNEWYNVWLTSDKYSDFHKTILDTKGKLNRRKEDVNPDKMVAEFTLGFWVMMFNLKYERLLWKPLRNVFANLPKKEKQRAVIASKLNNIRKFRNRIYHFEPIAWNVNAMKNNYKNICDVMLWMNKDYSEWVKKRCGFDNELSTQITILKSLGIQKLDY